MNSNSQYFGKGKLLRKFVAVITAIALLILYFPYESVEPAKVSAATKELKHTAAGIEISSEDDLRQLATSTSYRGTTDKFIQTADITLTNPWDVPINDFKGTYDGNGYRIKNFFGNQSRKTNTTGTDDRYYGLFGRVGSIDSDTTGELKNIIIEMGTSGFNVNIDIVDGETSLYYRPDQISKKRYFIGVLSGACDNSKITNCAVLSGSSPDFTVTTNRDYANINAGTIAGSTGRTAVIDGCYSNISIKPAFGKTYYSLDEMPLYGEDDKKLSTDYGKFSYHYFGGLIGSNGGTSCTLQNSVFNGSFSISSIPRNMDTVFISGLVGESNSGSSIKNCYADMSNTSTDIFNNFSSDDSETLSGYLPKKLIVSDVTSSLSSNSYYISDVYYNILPTDSSFKNEFESTNYSVKRYIDSDIRRTTYVLAKINRENVYTEYHFDYDTYYSYSGVGGPIGGESYTSYSYYYNYCFDTNESSIENDKKHDNNEELATELNKGQKNPIMCYNSKYKVCPTYLTAIPKPVALPAGGSTSTEKVTINSNSPIQIINRANTTPTDTEPAYDMYYKWDYTKKENAPKPTLSSPENCPTDDLTIDGKTYSAYQINKNDNLTFTSTLSNPTITYKVNDGSSNKKYTIGSEINIADEFITHTHVKITLSVSHNNYTATDYDYYFVQRKLNDPVPAGNYLPSSDSETKENTVNKGDKIIFNKNPNDPANVTVECSTTEKSGYTTIPADGYEITSSKTLYVRSSGIGYISSTPAKYVFTINKTYVTQPTFDFNNTNNTLTIRGANTADKIKYTLNGSDPSENNGTPFNGAITVSDAKTIKAYAYREGTNFVPSGVVSFSVSQLSPPTLSFNGTTKKVSVTTGAGEDAFYSIVSGTGYTDCSDTINILSPTTVYVHVSRAATSTNGYINSADATMTITRLATPTISFDAPTNTVTMNNATDGPDATIYYTIGSNATLHKYEVPFTISETTKFTAHTEKDSDGTNGYLNSENSAETPCTYTKPTCVTPEFEATSPSAYSFEQNTTQTISVGLKETTDGSTPEYLWEKYNTKTQEYEAAGSIIASCQVDTDTVTTDNTPLKYRCKVKNTKDGYDPSVTVEKYFTVTITAPAPAGNAVQGAKNTDGTNTSPSANSYVGYETINRDFKADNPSTKYPTTWTKAESQDQSISVPDDINTDSVLTLQIALTEKDTQFDESKDTEKNTLVTYYYTVSQKCATPIITPYGSNTKIDTSKNIQISCTTKDSVIRYTTNGTDPKYDPIKNDYNGEIYDQPIIFKPTDDSLTVKAIAYVPVKSGDDPNNTIDVSDIAEMTYGKQNRQPASVPILLMGDDNAPFDEDKYYEIGTVVNFTISQSEQLTGLTILYLVDPKIEDMTPDTYGQPYDKEKPYKLQASSTGKVVIKAVSTHTKYSNSNDVTFTIHVKSTGKKPEPSIPNGSTVRNGQELTFKLNNDCIPASMKPTQQTSGDPAVTEDVINTQDKNFIYNVPEIWYMIDVGNKPAQGNPITDGQLYVQSTPKIINSASTPETVIPARDEQPITLTGNPGDTITIFTQMNGADTNYGSSEVLKLTYTLIGKASTPKANPTTTEEKISTILGGDKIYLTTETAGASIYYTIDGSAPIVEPGNIGKNTKLYDPNTAIEVPKDKTGFFTVMAVTAKFKDANNKELALENSDVATFSYEFPAAVQAPFSIPSQGNVVYGTQIKFKSSTEGAQIFYEMGSSKTSVKDPDPKSSTMYDEANPIIIKENTVIKAVAFKNQVMSEIMTYSYTIASTVAAPESSISSGSVAAKGSILKLSTKTEGADIVYTLDGSDPKTENNSSAITGKEILVSDKLGETMTVRAYAKKDGMTPSEVVTFSFIVNSENGGLTAFPSTGTLIGQNTVITLTTTISGATIYYTTDGSVPTANSKKGSQVVATGNPGGILTVKAIALTNGSDVSPVASFTYTFQKRAPSPTASIPNNSILKSGAKVSLFAAENAIIYYTTDGSEPTTSSNQYVSQITVDTSMLIKAIAVNTGYEPSETATFNYTLADCCFAPTPSIPAGKVDIGTKVTLSCATEGATIYYTTNGKEPDANDTRNMLLYSSPITISRNVTLKMIAVKDGNQPSTVNIATYTVNEPVVIEKEDPTKLTGNQSNKLASRRNFSESLTGPSFSDILLTEKQFDTIVSSPFNIIPKNTLLNVKNILTSDGDRKAVKTVLGESYDIATSYDISLTCNGDEVKPDGQIEVGIQISGQSSNALIQVCRLNDDGTVSTFQTRRDGDTAYFMTENLGRFAVVSATPSYNTNNGINIAIIIILASVLVACGFGVFVLFQKNGKRSIDRHLNR